VSKKCSDITKGKITIKCWEGDLRAHQTGENQPEGYMLQRDLDAGDMDKCPVDQIEQDVNLKTRKVS